MMHLKIFEMRKGISQQILMNFKEWLGEISKHGFCFVLFCFSTVDHTWGFVHALCHWNISLTFGVSFWLLLFCACFVVLVLGSTGVWTLELVLARKTLPLELCFQHQNVCSNRLENLKEGKFVDSDNISNWTKKI
jgi:hypothetical protein